MIQETDRIRKSPLSWRVLFGLKLIFDLALTGVFYFENSMTIFWRLSFVVISMMVFLLINLFYLKMKKKQTWLFPILIIDFLVSASYGYVYIGGKFPNHLFIGITALAILMLLKNTRMLIGTCLLLLVVYVVTMGSIDWQLYKKFDEIGYFISCSFIVFAGIVSSLINYYQRARNDTMQLYAQLMQSHERLQDYALKTEEWAATKERVRIARDIHDTVGHKLTALLIQMQAARKLSGLDSLRSEQTYLACEDLIRSSLQEVRLSVRAIRDEPVKSASLNDSLATLSEEFTQFTEVQTVFESIGIPVALSGNLQITAYRIVQESLTNAQKHGHAKNVKIRLVYAENGFSLCIRNDGDLPVELKPGFGLINMKERVEELHGEVHVYMDHRKGFAIEVQLPYSLMKMERAI
ncbi:sensor histidine kinase [Paenibacillus sp. SYP-B3998]|uniref:histidine kinase n=2 Tax=Paenibacillus sp. SYP-B3998 TaxID=2678564 RepID=A0A6G4A1J5_9BACL|nr:sensor histidine kinase [Paenibacillus sp. SYP-B3998]